MPDFRQSMSTVSHALDTLSPLTEAQRRHMDDLAAQPDVHIDLTHMPELTDTQLAEMWPAAHHRPDRAKA